MLVAREAQRDLFCTRAPTNRTAINLRVNLILLTELPEHCEKKNSPVCYALSNFCTGKVASFRSNWQRLTSDPWIIDVVKGSKIEFLQDPAACRQVFVSQTAVSPVMDSLLQKFMETNKIEYTSGSRGFFSNVFLVEKRDQSHRAFLHLTNRMIAWNIFISNWTLLKMSSA